MAILNDSYQYIGRSNALGSPAGWKYYILLYAKTSGNISTGQHTVTVLQRLACDVESSFYGFNTSGSATVGGANAFSWSWAPIPGAAWNTSSITVDGYTYPRWIDLKEGAVVVNTGYGVTKDVTISSSLVMKESYSAAWFPNKGTEAKVNVTATLPMIASASTITSATNVTLGNNCSVTWTPQAASFRYKLKFSIGDWSHTTGIIHPNTTVAYTYTGYPIPLDAATQIPDSTTGTMTVTLETYPDSDATARVGAASSETFTITVPDNDNTRPTVSMTISPVGSLPAAFAGLYIQGLTKVKASLSATGKYGTTINSYHMWADGTYYDVTSNYTSDYYADSGGRTVYGYATDKRGFTGRTWKTIDVIPYTAPRLENTSVIRCDKNGNASDNGTYLKIKAKRSYSPVVANGVQKNFCKIQYRHKTANGSYSGWVTILESNSLASDEVTTGALLNGALSTQVSYVVHLRAIDDIGRYAEAEVLVPTENVYWHRDGANNSLGLGKYAEEPNTLDIAWDIKTTKNIAAAGDCDIGGLLRANIGWLGYYRNLDFNAVIGKTGYYVDSSTPGAIGCVNYPVDATGMLEVIAYGQSFAHQTYRTHDGRIYTRSYFNARGWSEWKQVQFV